MRKKGRGVTSAFNKLQIDHVVEFLKAGSSFEDPEAAAEAAGLKQVMK